MGGVGDLYTLPSHPALSKPLDLLLALESVPANDLGENSSASNAKVKCFCCFCKCMNCSCVLKTKSMYWNTFCKYVWWQVC